MYLWFLVHSKSFTFSGRFKCPPASEQGFTCVFPGSGNGFPDIWLASASDFGTKHSDMFLHLETEANLKAMPRNTQGYARVFTTFGTRACDFG